MLRDLLPFVLWDSAPIAEGCLRDLRAVCIGPEDDIERRQREIAAAAKSVDMSNGVVIATDMFGGTPSNLAISAMEGAKIDVIAGINLPMLIKLASIRDDVSLEQAVTQAQDAGRKYISVASRILTGK